MHFALQFRWLFPHEIPARLHVFASQFQGFVCIKHEAGARRRPGAYPASSFSACQLHISMSLRIAAGIAQPSGHQAVRRLQLLPTALGVEWAPRTAPHHVLIANGPECAHWTDAASRRSCLGESEKGKSEWKKRKKIIMLIKCDDHKSSLWQLKSALNAPLAADSS